MRTRFQSGRGRSGPELRLQPRRRPHSCVAASLTLPAGDDEHAHLGGPRGAAPLAALRRPSGLLHGLGKRTAGVLHRVQPRGWQPAAAG